MTDHPTFKSIIQNGGWCELHYRPTTALISTLGGRLKFHNDELAFIEKFDLRKERLKGYIVVLNKTRQRLKKANWINRYLKVGGRTIADSPIPKAIFAETTNDLLNRLKISQEVHLFRTKEKEVEGLILDSNDSYLTVEVSPSLGDCEKVTIELVDIMSIEISIGS